MTTPDPRARSAAAPRDPLRAHGERFVPRREAPVLHPWLLACCRCWGASRAGSLSWRYAPETAGGGGAAAIEAHHQGRPIRRRVVPVKGVAAILALSAGVSQVPVLSEGAVIGWVGDRELRRALLG